MQKLEALLFDFAFIGYLAATILYLVYVRSRDDRHSGRGHKILLVSAAIHAISLGIGLWVEAHRPGHVAFGFWSNWFESLSLFSLLIVAVFLAVQRRARLAILGAFVLPWAVILMSVGLTQAFLASPRCPFASVEDMLNILNATRRLTDLPVTFGAFVHVPLIFFSYAAFANAFGIGLAFVIGERQIKSKHPTALSYRLPPLDEMDRVIARLVAAAFPALTLGLVLGLRWARLAYGTTWAWDAKVLWSVGIWAVYGFYLAVRYGLGWRGRRTAYLSLAGFGLVLVSYTVANFFSKFHVFVTGKVG